MSEKPDENKGEETQAAPVDTTKIEAKIEDVKDEISNTNDEDKDKEWRAGLNSALTKIQEELADLKKQTGASAEMAVLQQQVTELAAEVRKLQPTTPPPPSAAQSSNAAEGNPSPETKTETSSETPTPPQRRQRAWV